MTDEIARVYDAAAASYDQVGSPFYATIGAALVARMRLRPGDRVLDAGCGRGACLFPVAGAVGAMGEVVGIDVSARMVQETHHELSRRATANAVVTLGDAAAPDFPAGSFDAVVSGFVLRLLPDPLSALRAYAGLLRSGGRLGLTIYASAFASRWAPVEATLQRFLPDAPQLTSPLDPASGTAGLLGAAGFEDADVADEPAETRLAGPSEWWDYLWASGFRGRMERIPSHRRNEARDALVAAVAPLCESDGSLVMQHSVRFATATRP